MKNSETANTSTDKPTNTNTPRFYQDKVFIDTEADFISALNNCACENANLILERFHSIYKFRTYNLNDRNLYEKALEVAKDYSEKYILPEQISEEKRNERETTSSNNASYDNSQNITEYLNEVYEDWMKKYPQEKVNPNTLPINDFSCVEVIYPSNFRDFEFFDKILKYAKQVGFESISPVPNKQKSIVVCNNDMYVCQFVKFEHALAPCELVMSINWNTNDIGLAQAVPDTTNYRVATEALWLYILILLGEMNPKFIDIVAKHLDNRPDTTLRYNYSKGEICHPNGTPATWTEIAVALSAELELRKTT